MRWGISSRARNNWICFLVYSIFITNFWRKKNSYLHYNIHFLKNVKTFFCPWRHKKTAIKFAHRVILIVWFDFDSPSKMNWKRRIPEILFKITHLRKMLKTLHKWSVSIVTFVIDLRRKTNFATKDVIFCQKCLQMLSKIFSIIRQLICLWI